ncbi:hypothetical protein [Nocardia farcinica]|uniref:hypothetical protein n=1 Tax=Nocardia farcinica TaxID=37329 RepID=UPI0024563510|nr:hypothetical protein [Nocardia farcinica]
MTEPKIPWGRGWQCWSVADVEQLPTHSIISWRDSRDQDEETVALIARWDGPSAPVTLEHTDSSCYWLSDPEDLVQWPATVIRVGRPNTEGSKA